MIVFWNKVFVLLIIIFCAIDADQEVADNSYDCSDENALMRLDELLIGCGEQKWSPFPEPEVWDLRVCCFRRERDCLFNKVTRSMCAINDQMFAEEVRRRYEQLANECRNFSAEINDQICATVETNEVTEEECKQYIPCTLEDPIPQYWRTRGSNSSAVISPEPLVFTTVSLLVSIFNYF